MQSWLGVVLPFGPAEGIVLQDGGFALLLGAFAVFAAAFLGWLLFGMTTERLTLEEVVCPTRRRVAELIVRRTREGARLDVVSCSLLGKGRPITCGRECMRRPT